METNARPRELTYDVFYDVLMCEDVTKSTTVLIFLILLSIVSLFHPKPLFLTQATLSYTHSPSL